MNDETTRLINDPASSAPKQKPTFNPAPARKISSKTVAAGVGGFVAGAAVGAATIGAVAANPDDKTVEEVIPVTEENPQEENPQEENNTPQQESSEAAQQEAASTAESSSPIAESELKVATVHADNFNDAFAQARAEVGPGGVFEYNGQLYGTYLETEWNEMSAQDRADYYARVADAHPEYSPRSSQSTHHNTTTHAHATQTSAHVESSIPSDAEMIAVEPVDDGIRVLGVQQVMNDEGDIMNIALVEQQGDAALLVDVDNDGTIEVLLHDDNGDNQLQGDEIYDVTGHNIQVDDLVEAAGYNQDVYNTGYDDNMPDYTNDADFSMDV